MFVKRYRSETGATIIIDDTAYKDKRPEELKAEEKELSDTVSACLIEDARRVGINATSIL